MFKYECLKLWGNKTGKMALLSLVILLIVCSYFSVIYIDFVDDQGVTHEGIQAVRDLKSAKMAWQGVLNTPRLQEVIRANRAIVTSPEYLSEDVNQQNIAYARTQGFSDIRDLINQGFTDFSEYDYYRADTVTEDEVGKIYDNRMKLISDWVDSPDAEGFQFNGLEKAYIKARVNQLKGPFYYEDYMGYSVFFQYSPMIIMLTVIILTFLVSSLFPKEYQLRADDILFSTLHGRKKAIKTKVMVGLVVSTLIYFVMMLLYSLIIGLVFGTSGGEVPIQMDISFWKSLYNLTNFQQYILIIFAGYVGTMVMISFAMLMAAVTRSSLVSVLIPFIFVFLPSFLNGLKIAPDVFGLLPDQLMQLRNASKYYYLYTINQKVYMAIPLMLVAYSLLSVVIQPITYLIYKKKAID